MTISEKQLAANRQNARKSTGPKTPEGKAIVSQNHIQHGLYSGKVIIHSQHLQESQADYDTLVETLIAELHPEGLIQNLLVRKIANCFWRYRRVINAETAHINSNIDHLDADIKLADAIAHLGSSRNDSLDPLAAQVESWEKDKNKDKDNRNDNQNVEEEIEVDTETTDTKNMANLVEIRSIPSDTSSHLMLRYEMRFDRQLTRSLRLLAQLKRESRRAAEKDE
jgi:hypothetical protein